MVKVSVICPVYNTEKYLDDCIRSVINQSCSDWEMLLVDDGSSDCSLEICERYSRIDNRIKTIHQNNQGASSARNLALQYAKGKYIIFLDSDDYWIYSDVLSTLVIVADKYRLDLVRGEYICVSENAQFRVCSDSKVDREYSVERFSSSQFFRKAIHHEFFGPLTLFRRCAINTKFDENKRFLEDMLFYSRILTQNLSCGYLPDYAFYAYRKRMDSVSNTPQQKLLFDSFAMCYEFISLGKLSQDKETNKVFTNYAYYMYDATVKSLADSPYYSAMEGIINEINVNAIRHYLMFRKDFVRNIMITLILPPKIAVRLLYMWRLIHYKFRLK